MEESDACVDNEDMWAMTSSSSAEGGGGSLSDAIHARCKQIIRGYRGLHRGLGAWVGG